MKRKILLIFVLLLWSAVLFFFSGQSGLQSGDLSLRLAKWLIERIPEIGMKPRELEPILRKLAHVMVFALEGFLMYCTVSVFRMGKRGNWLIATAICAVIGGLNEVHQLYAVDRSCQFTDVLIDSAGAILGVAFAAFCGWMLHKLDRRLRV